MPDIIVRDKDDEHKLRLVIELKADKRATSAYPGRAAESKINDDLKKLNKFTKNSFLKKQIKCGIFVYLYRDTEWSENKIKKKISKKLHHGRLKIIVINRYWNAKKGKLYSQPTMDRIDEEFLASHKIVVGVIKSETCRRKICYQYRFSNGVNYPFESIVTPNRSKMSDRFEKIRTWRFNLSN